MTQRFTAHVDPHLCVGNAMCRAIAPNAFVLEAAASCPVGAITVTDADTGDEIDF